MDTAAVTVLLNASLEMDKATMVAAVRVTANAVDRAKADYRPLPAANAPPGLQRQSAAPLGALEGHDDRHVHAADGAGAHQHSDELHIG